MTRNCKHCGAGLVDTGKEGPYRFSLRQYCNKACTNAARAAKTLICRTPGDRLRTKAEGVVRARHAWNRKDETKLNEPMPWPVDRESSLRMRSSLAGIMEWGEG